MRQSKNHKASDTWQWIAAGAGLFLAATAVYNEIKKYLPEYLNISNTNNTITTTLNNIPLSQQL